ncbi:AmpG family muropeptide MFS transporter [Solimicrobium silvestre]|uniref:Major Facilitator Superfamily n=1 Tax=Solimicrobium silvestre TaxID=2099400 RepID=A0A2S9H3R5_9BURK|nr:AmpG family muropeptide MFS transporter [Solimicrobium silvestre]PRC94601.1 Major Facilitator Superfamily [Solimicrobium silvestre]
MQKVPSATNSLPPVEPTGWHQYLNQNMLICVALGFTSGLPLFILINLLTAWLKTEGVDLKAIGLFALVGFPYTWKFIWSPVMDRFSLPFLGRRRGWMFVTQLCLMAVIMAMGQLSPKTDLMLIVWLCGALAFLSASQDIVIDAYRREILSDNQQALGISLSVNAYKFSTLVPGSLALILSDHFNWDSVFIFTGLFMLPGIITTLLIKEPRLYGAPPKNIREAVVLPFQEFIQRKGVANALLILSFIFLYKLGDSMATALQTPFFMELGFTRTQIGVVAKSAGLWAGLAGGLFGAIWLMKIGINRGLWIFGVIQAVAILGFAMLTKMGLSVWMLGAVMVADTFAIGLGTAAFTAYIATTTDPRYTATQYALFSSLAVVPRTFFNAITGYIVLQTGWFGFFIICFLLTIPGMLLLPKIAPWNAKKNTQTH